MKTKRFWVIAMSVVLAIQIAAIVIFNFTRIRYVGGFDPSAAMAQAMEIWNQKTIFLKNWDYQATLGLDSILIPASLFYGITKNIYVAYAMANCLALALYIYVFRDVLKQLQVAMVYRLFAYIVLLTPYSLEPLGYMPMMFTNAAYYVMKVLIPVMLIDILLKIYRGISLKKFVPILIICGVYLFLTGFSCGLYLFICGLLPLIFHELWKVLRSGDIKTIYNKRMLVLLVGVGIFGLGLIVSKLYGQGSYTSGMMLTTATDFVDNFFKCFIGVAELFGALPYRQIGVISIYGMNYLSHLAALILFVFFAGYAVRRYLVKRTCLQMQGNSAEKYISDLDGNVQDGNARDEIEKLNQWKSTAIAMCLYVVAFNFLVLILTNTTYGSDTFEFRYHLIPMMASVVPVAIGLSEFVQMLKARGNMLAVHTTLAVVLLVWCMSNCSFAYYYTNNNSFYDTSEEVLKVIDSETDCKRVYFIGDDDFVIGTSRAARLRSDYEITDGYAFGSYSGWGTTTKYNQDAEDIKQIVIVSTEEIYETLDAEVKNCMSLIGTVDMLQIYEYRQVGR